VLEKRVVEKKLEQIKKVEKIIEAEES